MEVCAWEGELGNAWESSWKGGLNCCWYQKGTWLLLWEKSSSRERDWEEPHTTTCLMFTCQGHPTRADVEETTASPVPLSGPGIEEAHA